jgi:hypothetical protein
MENQKAKIIPRFISDEVSKKTGKAFWKVKTDLADFNVFDKNMADVLKAHINKDIEVEIQVKGEFRNIVLVEGADNKPKQWEKPAYAPVKAKFDHSTMYVSYVKDLVVSGKTLAEAISIIKLAKKEFEDDTA